MTYNKVSPYATTIRRNDEGFYECVYHSTIIVKWNEDTIYLNHGGWMTATTKKKMNQISNQFNLGYQVYQKDFNWFIDWNNTTIPFDKTEIMLFHSAED